MLSVSPNCMVRSSLEDMLEALQRRDEGDRPHDVPPALPWRAVSRSSSRPPSAKRRLPVSSEANEMGKSLEFSVKKGEMGKGKDIETESGDSFYVVAASAEKELSNLPSDSSPNKMKYFVEKIGEVQKDMDGHHDRQHLHELEEVAVTLQSYVRAEIARKAYRKVEPGSSISEVKNLPPERLSLLVEELQKRALMAEAALELKENENTFFREQVQQLKAQWSEFEAKMKSTEEIRQKQIASLQMSLAAAEKSLIAERTISRSVQRDGNQPPHTYKEMKGDLYRSCNGGVKEFTPRKVVTFEKEPRAAIIIEMKPDSHHAANPIEKFGRLKRMIRSWTTKDNKFQLKDSKTKIHSHSMSSMDHTEPDGLWKSWWGRKSKRPQE